MSIALPQSIGIGSVVGTATGNLLMHSAGYGESAVYLCAAAGGCLAPVAFAQLSWLTSRLRRLGAARHRLRWSNARMEALGQ